MESILVSIKKMLGIDKDYDHFDPEIIIHINSVLMVLEQLGVGPEEGFFITGNDEVWSVFLGKHLKHIEAVKTYVYLKVRLIFDPPTTSFLIDAITRQITELEWRLNVKAEGGK